MSVKVFKNNKEIDSKSEQFLHSPKALLLHFNEAAYTTTRTVNLTNILDFTTHFQRLAYGALRKIYPGNWSCNEVNAALSERVREELSRKIVSAVRYSLLSFVASKEGNSLTEQQIDEINNNYDHGNKAASRRTVQSLFDGNQNPTEARIYIILSPISAEENINVENKSEEERDKLIIDRINNEIDYWIYIEQLPDRKQHCSLEIRHHKKREHADLKSVEWVKERQDLENLLLSRAHLNINESILMDPVTHQLFEGLSSNFFILDQNDRVITAEDENVLVGTIMKLILDICHRLNIPVVRSAPTYDQLQSAKSAFISSTSRLLLPADKIYYPENEGGEIVLHYDYRNSLLQKIQSELLDNLVSNSYDLFK